MQRRVAKECFHDFGSGMKLTLNKLDATAGQFWQAYESIILPVSYRSGEVPGSWFQFPATSMSQFQQYIFAHVANQTGQGSSHSMPYRKRVMPNCGLVRSTRKTLPLKSACGPSFCTISCMHCHQSVHGSSPGAVSFCGTYTRKAIVRQQKGSTLHASKN